MAPQSVCTASEAANGADSADSVAGKSHCRPAGNDASLNLRRKIEYSFPLDLIVCDARRLAQRVKAGDFFLQDTVQFGKVLYEKRDR
jgi:hypothetical protein